MPSPLSPRFVDAVAAAAELHARQTRKDGRAPYFAHLLAVCAIVLEHGGDEDEAIAALLHDAAEDQGGAETLAQIRKRFGDRIADLVDDLSDSYGRVGEPRAPWRERKDAYLAALPGHSRSARLVSAADKLNNAATLLRDLYRDGEAVWERYEGGRAGTLWYYRALHDIFEETGPTALADEFGRILEQIEQVAGDG